ncbi:MAG: hypothetical protein IJM50_01090 [Lachnospiraceae bacterium]|nr:hypothetical protein [Lachnospiraceae bacterium]
MERAKELFLKYSGNRFYMDREGEGAEYDGYHVSRETEEIWAKEAVSAFLESRTEGKEAIRAYSSAAELVKSSWREAFWHRCLYYPLKTGGLDDVTVLFMLPISFRMAEKAAARHRFSREEAKAYLCGLDRYIALVRRRSAKGTLTRAADYTMGEFSDPGYVKDYTDGLKMKWGGLI